MLGYIGAMFEGSSLDKATQFFWRLECNQINQQEESISIFWSLYVMG